MGATLAVVTLPFFGVLNGTRTAMYADVNYQTVPFFMAVWRSIGAGHWPWWNPNIFGGHSMVGAGQFAVFYPFNFVFGWLDPTSAYRWWFLVHLWVAALSAFAWAWHRWRSQPGAVVAGAGYALSGFVVFHLLHPAFLAAAAWLPLVFLGIDLLGERWTRPRAFLVAGPLGMIGLLGQPQLIWIAGLGGGCYALGRHLGRGADLRALGRIGLALAGGVGLAAIQLIPLFEFSRTSVRPDLTLEAAFEGSIEPHQMLMLIFPYLFGGSTRAPWTTAGLEQEVGTYIGMAIIALAIVGVAAWRRDRGVRGLCVVSVVAVLVALGGSIPLGQVIHGMVPGARLFRNWGRTLVLLNLAVAVLAGLGAREVLHSPRRFLPGLLAAAVATMALAELLPNLAGIDESIATGSAGGFALALPAILLVGVAAAAGLAIRSRRAGVGALVVVCAFDLILFASIGPWRISASPEVTRAFYEQSTPAFGLPHDAPGGIDRWASSWYGFRSLSVISDLYGVNGYDPLVQAEWAETAGGWTYDGFPTRGDLWEPGWTADVLRVSTLILQEQIEPRAEGWLRESAVPGLDFVRWVREPRLPEAYLVGGVTVASLDAIRAKLTDPQTRLDQVAYVERSPGPGNYTRPGGSGSVISADVLGSGEVVVEADSDSLLVLSHTWAEGWSATVDGRSAPVLRTNGLVLGVPVPAGRHVVRIAFFPPGLLPGAVVAVASLLALLAAGPVAARLRARRREATAAPGSTLSQ